MRRLTQTFFIDSYVSRVLGIALQGAAKNAVEVREAVEAVGKGDFTDAGVFLKPSFESVARGVIANPWLWQFAGTSSIRQLWSVLMMSFFVIYLAPYETNAFFVPFPDRLFPFVFIAADLYALHYCLPA